MTRFRDLAALLSATALAAQPCFGADLFQDGHSLERRMGAYAGASVRIGLGAGEREAPSARLKLGMTGHETDRRSGARTQAFDASAVELGLGGGGRPLLWVGGRSTEELERRMGLDGTQTTLLVIGGLALAAGAALLLAGEDEDEEEYEVCITIVPKPPGCP